MKTSYFPIQTKLITAAGLILMLAASRAWSQLPTFTQITNSPVVTDSGNFVGVAWADFSNTGFQDLLVTGYFGETNIFYHNNGDGTFTRVSAGDPVLDLDYHVGAVAGDYDNDGHPDLFISAGAFSPSATHNKLFHNNGDGTFSSVSGGVVTSQVGHFGPCNWVDYDQDGFLDLFVA